MLKWPVFPCNRLFGGVSILGIIVCMYISVHVHVEQYLTKFIYTEDLCRYTQLLSVYK